MCANSVTALFNRREFLALCAGGMAVSAIGAESQTLRPITWREIEIPVGAASPFCAVHVSDTHLIDVDARENERKLALAKNRQFSARGKSFLDQALLRARNEKAVFLHTGDFIDFVSEANLERVASSLASVDSFACVGNHEFSQYVGEAREDAAYKQQSYARVQQAYQNDLTFSSRIINGVNFIAFDNGYYTVTEEQVACFEREVKKGLPIVLLCHVPFYTPELYAATMRSSAGRCAYLMAVPDNLVAAYPKSKNVKPGEEWRHRSVQQMADATTHRFHTLVKGTPLVKAILCGHVHHFHESVFSPTARQCVCAATYKGESTFIRFT